MKYRKKPIEVDAYRLTDDPDRDSPEWFTAAVREERIWIDRCLTDGHVHVYGCTIETDGGRMKARLGDYIIHEEGGAIYSCRPGVFKEVYEAVK